jgi:hypothetical protein
MAQYKVRSGEGIFDIAAKLYRGDTAGGIQDLLTLNPEADLDADDLYGTTLLYTENLNRSKEKFPVVNPTPKGFIYKTRERQTVYDLSIQLFGDISQIRNLLELFPNLNGQITVGSEIAVAEQTDPMALYFTDRNLIVATDLDVVIVDVDNILLENSDNILMETGDLILLE